MDCADFRNLGEHQHTHHNNNKNNEDTILLFVGTCIGCLRKHDLETPIKHMSALSPSLPSDRTHFIRKFGTSAFWPNSANTPYLGLGGRQGDNTIGDAKGCRKHEPEIRRGVGQNLAISGLA